MSKRFWDYSGTVIALLLIIIVVGCGGNEKTATKEERAISVKGMVTMQSSAELTKKFTGTLEGVKQAVITAKIAEAVEKVNYKEGDKISANAVLMSLDKTGPTSNYVQAYSVFKNAEKNFNKMKYLYEEGAVSESQFDGAKTEYEVAQANFTAAEKLVDIRTPISGTVTSVNASVGDYLLPGQKVATVADISRLRMNLGISGSDIKYFKVGADVNVSVGTSENLSGGGQVATVARSADPVTRTFQVEIAVANESGQLKPGMFAESEITVAKFENIIIIPRDAAVNRENRNYVYIINGDRVVAREVVLGAEFNGSVEIKQGLNPGDTLVTVGQDYLDDGFLVKLVRFVDAEGKEIEL